MRDDDEARTTKVPTPADGETRSLAQHAADAFTVGGGIILGAVGTRVVGAIKDKLSAPKDESPKIERPSGYNHD